MKMIEVQVPVVRRATCDTSYDLVAPLIPPRWIYSQPKACKRAKHPLATQEGVDFDAVETLPMKALIDPAAPLWITDGSATDVGVELSR